MKNIILSAAIILIIISCKKKEQATPTPANTTTNFCWTCWETNKNRDTAIGPQFSFCNKDTAAKYATSNGPYYQCKNQ